MVQGGATDTGDSEVLIENIVKYISGKEDLLQQLEALLKLNSLQKEGEIFDESAIKHVSELLMKDKDLLKNAIDIVKEYLEKNNNELKILLEQVNKVKGMEEKLEALGNQLLVQGVIGGAAVTTLTGTLAGLLTVGGVTGALIGGGAALVGFVALFAIDAIGYAIYQHRGEIKKGAIDAGKAVKSFVKNVIDKLTWEKTNFSRLEKEFIHDMVYPTDDEKSKEAQNKIRIIKMLQDEGKRSAIQELVKNGTIQNFSKDDMSRLMNKGLSTHESDMEAFKNLVDQFQPVIMAIGSDIKEVEQKVNEKAQEMKPNSHLGISSAARVSEGRITGPN
ncbi:glycine zipper family protein [Wolbachia endosymbiont (group A) of Andrena fulva]|uniref:glycine zipper family protein n=1 Tax=Wolbachia endosymbiont (group A) of Andrena fulva TaxID=3066191 RepID=UPI003132D887